MVRILVDEEAVGILADEDVVGTMTGYGRNEVGILAD